MYDAVVLAGGSGRRLGGVDKPALVIGGIPLLDRVLRACDGAATTVVVGPRRPTCRPVLWAREEPPGGGPVAALDAALALVTAPVLLLLAADLPFLTPAAVAQLVDELPAGTDGRVHLDGTQPQWLTSAWRTASLRSCLHGRPVRDARLGALLEPLATVQLTSLADAGQDPWFDIDTQDDLRRATTVLPD